MRKLWFVVLCTVAVVSLQSATVNAAVNDFTITNYAIHYDLGRDAAGRSTLETTETITAVFPGTNQNHGLERAFPNTYDGHSTSLKIQSVTNVSGAAEPYSLNRQGDVTVLRIGKADSYVHGSKTYVIRYSARDVTKYFKDTGRDEFYWDTNGTAWRVPITNISVSLRVDGSIQKNLTGDKACYQGLSGSTATCELRSGEAVNQYTVMANNLGAGENVTIAIGFMPKTFQGYQPSGFERVILWWGCGRLHLGLCHLWL